MGTTPTTVIGGLGPGLGQSINPFSPQYQDQVRIATLAAQATAANANAAVAYTKEAQDWIQSNLHNRDLGLPLTTIPDPPLAIHIDQSTGAQASGPDYVGGLTKPSLPAPTGVPSAPSIASPNPTPDRTDQILNGLALMYTMMATLQAEVAAMKAHFGL